jgi:integrase
MVAGDVKTEASKKAVPLDDFMIEELLAWYTITPYKKGQAWVFASDSHRAGVNRGKQPYWPSTIMRHFIQPLAKQLGIGNISWHTFRHTTRRSCMLMEKIPRWCRSCCGIRRSRSRWMFIRRQSPLPSGKLSRAWWR